MRVFRSHYRPIMDAAPLDRSELRVLELGAGLGRTTQAFVREYAPALYIASEPFSSLAVQLRQSLNAWDYRWPKGVAANYNANCAPLLRPGAVNVILGNSVLHHILDYECGLEHWREVLDTPGIMIFGEPIKEGWVYWTSLVLAVLQAWRGGTVELAQKSADTLERHSRIMRERIANHDNRSYLAGLDDKHMFSPLKMMALADRLHMSLSVHKLSRDVLQLMRIRLERIGVAETDARTVLDYLREIVPVGIQDTAMSDFAAMFVFRKV